ncbi:MAG: hypothetical protein PUC15_08360 [Lentisphaeria bacterium]|nr:hypothetical protein [Lentisphaeria bacterium]
MRAATAAELKEQIALIHECLKVMKKGTHYDVLPNCGKKNTLLKPGAEVILTMFRISAEPIIERESDGFDVTYHVTVIGRHIPTGNIVGYGVGEASTSEKKYKWREAVCDEEFQNTPETRRQIAWVRDKDDKNLFHEVKQVRQNPADLMNTVLKMAKKRAIVDLCLTSTACSDIFVQDMDDPDINNAVNQGENASKQQQGSRYTAPQRRSQGAAPAPAQGQSAPPSDVISDAQRKRLYAIGKSRNLSDDEMGFLVYDVAHVNRSDEIPRKLYDAVVAEFEKATPGNVIPMDEGN